MRTRVLWLTLAVAIFVAIGVTPAFANQSGAVFTTTVDGSRVTANIFTAKTSVFLSGGSGSNAPASVAGLIQGWYVFQVTDPTGTTLLSQDPVGCRRFHVNSHGVIDQVMGGDWTHDGTTGYFEHQTGTDAVHGGAPSNAITVQLMPFASTPNTSGVYKVWAMLESDFVAANGSEDALTQIDPPGHVHGFVRAKSKVDSFKIGGNAEQRLTVQNFCDANGNGTWDADEKEISGWPERVGEPSGIAYDPLYSSISMITQVSGTWSVSENDAPVGDPRDWKQTALTIDGARKTPARSASIRFSSANGEKHKVVFGNVPLGEIAAHKFHDRDCNGVQDSGEENVAGFRFRLTGTAGAASGYAKTISTNAKGLAEFDKLLPGTYTLTEEPKSGWLPTTQTSRVIDLATSIEGANDPVVVTEDFGNAESAVITASKFSDDDADGEWDSGESAVSGWGFMLTGTDRMGNEVAMSGLTDSKGKIRWEHATIEGDIRIPGMYPGDYVVREVLRSDTELILASGLSYRINGGRTVRMPPARTLDAAAGAGQEWSISFGGCAPGTMRAIALQDDDADGIGDRPKEGWMVTLTGTTGLGDPVKSHGPHRCQRRSRLGRSLARHVHRPGRDARPMAGHDRQRVQERQASVGRHGEQDVRHLSGDLARGVHVQGPRCRRISRARRAQGGRHHRPHLGRTGRQHRRSEALHRLRRTRSLRPSPARNLLRRAGASQGRELQAHGGLR